MDTDKEVPESAISQEANKSWQSYVFRGADGLRAGWALLIWIVIASAISSIFVAISKHLFHTPVVARGSTLEPLFTFTGEAISLFVVLAATCVMSFIEKRRFGSYGLGVRGGLFHFLSGSLLGICLLSVLIALLASLHLLIFSRPLLNGGALIHYGILWAIIFFLLAMFEENMLRGYAQFTLGRGIGFWWSAIILSSVFGFAHKNNAGESPLGLLSAALVGMVFCFSLWRTGHLWWAIGFHAAWDWGQSFLFGVANSGTMIRGHMFATSPQGNVWLSGGSTGPEGSVFILPILISAALWVHFTQRSRGGVARVESIQT